MRTAEEIFEGKALRNVWLKTLTDDECSLIFDLINEGITEGRAESNNNIFIGQALQAVIHEHYKNYDQKMTVEDWARSAIHFGKAVQEELNKETN